jgi:hypothetical protein
MDEKIKIIVDDIIDTVLEYTFADVPIKYLDTFEPPEIGITDVDDLRERLAKILEEKVMGKMEG